jgi:hypothetical protein
MPHVALRHSRRQPVHKVVRLRRLAGVQLEAGMARAVALLPVRSSMLGFHCYEVRQVPRPKSLRSNCGVRGKVHPR